MAEALGFDYAGLLEEPGIPLDNGIPEALANLDTESTARTRGDVIERLELLCRQAYRELGNEGCDPEKAPAVVNRLLGIQDTQVEGVLRHAS